VVTGQDVDYKREIVDKSIMQKVEVALVMEKKLNIVLSYLDGNEEFM